jgi:hypothetical protein
MKNITEKILYTPVIAAMEGTVSPNLDPETNTLSDLIANALTNFIIPTAAALAVGFVIYSGVLYITSAGDPEKTAKAKKSLMWSIVGVILIVLAIPIVIMITREIGDEILK